MKLRSSNPLESPQLDIVKKAREPLLPMEIVNLPQFNLSKGSKPK